MESSPKEPRGRFRFKSVLTFIVHQLVGTWGIAFFAYFSGSYLLELFGPFGRAHWMRSLHWILTETPFFPVQIALGLYSGWVLGRRLKHRSMMWVWVIPGLILCYAVVAMLNLSPPRTLVSLYRGGSLSHYFGWGCQPRDRCLDQLLITMPFYAATAYSIGARLAFTSATSHP
jgi:hypothetical protein